MLMAIVIMGDLHAGYLRFFTFMVMNTRSMI
jgi:hypothetical protein